MRLLLEAIARLARHHPAAVDSHTVRKVQAVSDEPAEIARQLVDLRIEHRDLDAAIARLSSDARGDELQLRRLKKRKLKLKDTIARLESKLIPDLDA
jgi:hypothetical protein